MYTHHAVRAGAIVTLVVVAAAPLVVAVRQFRGWSLVP